MPPAWQAGLPVPGQQLIEIVDIVRVDAGEHVGDLALGIKVVELGGLDPRISREFSESVAIAPSMPPGAKVHGIGLLADLDRP
jgi:hypothetical protein